MPVNHRAGGWAPKARKAPAGSTPAWPVLNERRSCMRLDWAVPQLCDMKSWNKSVVTLSSPSFHLFSGLPLLMLPPNCTECPSPTEMSYVRFPAGMSQAAPSHIRCTAKDTKSPFPRNKLKTAKVHQWIKSLIGSFRNVQLCKGQSFLNY